MGLTAIQRTFGGTGSLQFNKTTKINSASNCLYSRVASYLLYHQNLILMAKFIIIYK